MKSVLASEDYHKGPFPVLGAYCLRVVPSSEDPHAPLPLQRKVKANASQQAGEITSSVSGSEYLKHSSHISSLNIHLLVENVEEASRSPLTRSQEGKARMRIHHTVFYEINHVSSTRTHLPRSKIDPQAAPGVNIWCLRSTAWDFLAQLSQGED